MNFKLQLKQFTQLYLSNQNILSFTIFMAKHSIRKLRTIGQTRCPTTGLSIS